MPEITPTLRSLVKMSRSLGKARRGYVMLGEGNTAAREDEQSFWVKASGFSLSLIHI